jgi:hypothetical protein
MTRRSLNFRSLVDDDLITQNVYRILYLPQSDIIDHSAYGGILFFFRGKGFGFQEVIQNLADFFKRQVEVGEDVEQEVPMVEWIHFHLFPREKFGPILAKNKTSIKIFFARE